VERCFLVAKWPLNYYLLSCQPSLQAVSYCVVTEPCFAILPWMSRRFFIQKKWSLARGSTFLPSSPIDATHFSVTSAIQGYTCFTNTTSIHWCFHRHISCHWLEAPAGAVHGKLGFNRWKKIVGLPSVPVNSQTWTARCGDRYDPQPVKRSSEWVSEPQQPYMQLSCYSASYIDFLQVVSTPGQKRLKHECINEDWSYSTLVFCLDIGIHCRVFIRNTCHLTYQDMLYELFIDGHQEALIYWWMSDTWLVYGVLRHHWWMVTGGLVGRRRWMMLCLTVGGYSEETVY